VTQADVLLCDADGNLFPSEEPAFAASAEVTNRMLAELGSERSYDPAGLRAEAVGRNFRSTALELAARHGLTLPAATLERYVEEERRTVTAYLARVLRPDPAVQESLSALTRRYRLAAVSSSATARLDVCFRAAGLDEFFPAHVRFSAEDSLPVPTSKPDPAIYRHAGEVMGVSGEQALAIEDAKSGVLSAVAAGFPTIGNMVFVPLDERASRRQALADAGALLTVESWAELVDVVSNPGAAAAKA
jgi:beta-phosphoglucomutase-like phosphatase (HAD superfamily)